MKKKDFMASLDVPKNKKTGITKADFMGSIPRSAVDDQRNTPAGIDAINGVSGMDQTSKNLVGWAQEKGGTAGGDIARALVQAPGHLVRGLGSGAQNIGGSMYQLAGDAMGSFGENDLSRAAQRQAKENHAVANEWSSAGMENYQTATGRGVGQGINSLGNQLPLDIAAMATGNPYIAILGGGAMQAGTTYLDDRVTHKMSPLAAGAHGLRQGTYESVGEILPAHTLTSIAQKGFGRAGSSQGMREAIGALATGNPAGAAGQAIKALPYTKAGRYLLENVGGEMATEVAQGLDNTVTLRNNPEGWKQFKDGLADDLYETAIASLAQGGGQLGTAGITRAVKDIVTAPPSPTQPKTKQEFMQSIDDVAPKAATQPDVTAPTDAPKIGNALLDSIYGAQKPFTTRDDVPVAQVAAAPVPTPATKQRNQVSGMAAVDQVVGRIIGAESSGNPNAKNPNSSATGLGQFIDSTWTKMMGKYRSDLVKGKSREEVLAMRTNPSLAREMTVQFTKDNARGLSANGLAVTPGNLYMAHHFGVGGANQLLKVGDKSVLMESVVKPIVMKQNPHFKGKTVAQVINNVYSKVGDSGSGHDVAIAADDGGQHRLLSDYGDTDTAGVDQANYAMQDAAKAQREAAEEMAYASRKLGKKTTVRMSDQKEAATLALLEADDLSPTVADGQNQYRDRNRAASQIQVNNIANNLDPEILGDSKLVDTGAPTLASDGRTIIGGNGRTLGILQAYQDGKAEHYKHYLADHAAELGLKASDILAMNKPVLVRQLDNAVDVGKAAIASNEGTGLGMSALEQSRVDADRMPNFGTFTVGDGGDFNSVANRGFIRDWVAQMPVTVQASMVDAGGNLSQDGVRRLRNAMLYRAYGNSPALSRMVESTDQGARNMVNAMVQMAPKIANAKSGIKAGAIHDADISNDIVGAVEKINQLRDQGMSVADYLAQQGMFEEDLTPVAKGLVKFLDEHKRSAKAISTLLNNYYDVLEAQGSPNQNDIFNDTATPDRSDILKRAENDYRQQNEPAEETGDIFAEPERAAEQREPGEPSQDDQHQPDSAERDAESLGDDAGAAEQSGQVERIQAAVNEALGNKARHVTVIEAMRDRPDDAKQLVDGRIEGWYEPSTKQIVLVANSLTPERAQWVAWHELGHRGVDTKHFADYKAIMGQADKNMAVQELADAIRHDRRGTDDPALRNRAVAVEEALVELYAATKTSDYSHIEDRYGVVVPAAFKANGEGVMARLAARIKLVLNKVFGEQFDYSDAQIFDLLKRIDRGNKDQATSEGLQKYSQGPGNQIVIDQAKARLLRIGEAIREGKHISNEAINVGQTPEVLTQLGVAQLPVVMPDPKKLFQIVQKDGDGRHGIDPGVLSQIPEAIQSPLAVFDSATQANAKVVVTELQDGAGQPVIVAFHLDVKQGRHQINKLASIYGRSNAEAAFKKWSDDGLLKYLDTKRPELIQSAGLQLPMEGVKSGLIKNVLQPSDIVNKNKGETKLSRAPKTDMGKQERTLFNEIGELNAGVQAYDYLTEKMRPIFAKVGLANTHGESFTQYMRDYRATLNASGMKAKEMAELAQQVSPEDRKLLSDVLEKEVPQGAFVSDEVRELAQAMRYVLNQQSDDLVALNMLSKDSANRFRETYLPRIYHKHMNGLFEDTNLTKVNREFQKAMRGGLGKSISGSHLKGRGIFKSVPIKERSYWEKEGYEVREDKGDGKLLMWRDYTRSERQMMGEERDAAARFTSGYVKTQADIAKGILFNRIALDDSLSSNIERDGWERVPTTEIAGTGGVKRYGSLAGKFVHPEVAYHLEQQFFNDKQFQKIWRATLGWWKVGKTVYNAVAHVNNVVSNIAMYHIAGGMPKDLVASSRSLMKKDALYKEAMEQGLIGDYVDVAGLQEMFVGLGNESDHAIMDNFMTRTLKKADKLALGAVSKSAKFAQKAYRVEDEVFKVALYKRGRDQGLSKREAADYALTYMFDYSEIPKGAKRLRDAGILPFVSYTYKAIPALARAALTRPHRFLSVTAAMYALNALSYFMLGADGDEEEERKFMPEYQKGFTVFGTPKLLRMPFNDGNGDPVFIDVYRWLPLGDFADTQNQMGGLSLPQWMMPNGPAINHYSALISNKDTFTGKELVKDYMPESEKAIIRAKWVASQWIPSSVGVPYSYHTNNILDGMKSQFEGTAFSKALEAMGFTGKNYRGENVDLGRAALGSVGIKVRGQSVEDAKARHQRSTGYQIRELKSDISSIRKNQKLTEGQRRAQIERRQEAIQRLIEKGRTGN